MCRYIMGLHWPWGLNNRLKKFGAEGKEKPLQLNYQEPQKSHNFTSPRVKKSEASEKV